MLLLLLISLAVDNGEFDHRGGGGGGGSPVAAAAAAGVAVDNNWRQKAAGNKSVDGCMTACNDESGQWTTTQQPTK